MKPVMSGTSPGLRVAHLTASPFYGGPERQMIGLACAMPPYVQTTFLSLMEGGRAEPFVNQLQARGLRALCLHHNHPNLPGAIHEIIAAIRFIKADVLLTHGYKPDILGWVAARWAGVPIVMVSRGWTAITRKVRFYEMLDRRMLRRADRVVCVSEGQADKVRSAGVCPDRVMTIHNSVDVQRFASVDLAAGQSLRSLFPGNTRQIVLAAGRLSPEKGFDQLVTAARIVCSERQDVGFALFGDGPLKPALHDRIRQLGLENRFVLAGFCSDLDALLPHAACLVQSSHTEGMPNVVLEAMAAGVPVVATAVGGTPELVISGETGHLVPPADPQAIAEGVLDVLSSAMDRVAMGMAARRRVEEHFSFASQAQAYERLLSGLTQTAEVPAYAPSMARV